MASADKGSRWEWMACAGKVQAGCAWLPHFALTGGCRTCSWKRRHRRAGGRVHEQVVSRQAGRDSGPHRAIGSAFCFWASLPRHSPPALLPCCRTRQSSTACAAPATRTVCTAPARGVSLQARRSDTACTSQASPSRHAAEGQGGGQWRVLGRRSPTHAFASPPPSSLHPAAHVAPLPRGQAAPWKPRHRPQLSPSTRIKPRPMSHTPLPQSTPAPRESGRPKLSFPVGPCPCLSTEPC